MEGIFDEVSKFSKINPDNFLLTEKEKSAVELYNSAINAFSLKNEDIAIIELKKSVALNPEFYEAKTLLGICYYHMGAYEKAEVLFREVGRVEKNGMLAHEIKAHIKKSDEPLKPKKKPFKLKPAVAPVHIKTKPEKKSIIIKYLIGLGIGLLACLIFGIFTYFSGEMPVDIEKIVMDYEKDVLELDTRISQADGEIEKTNEKVAVLEEEKEVAKKQGRYLQNATNLYKAENLNKSGKKDEARVLLDAINKDNLESAFLERYDLLREELK